MHADNITSLVVNKLSDNQICILGDYNLSNVSWSGSFSNSGLTPLNVISTHESYFIDSLLSLNLIQVNSFVNKLDRILDLIFISDNLIYDIAECFSPITSCDKHHVPLILNFKFYEFPSAVPDDRISFNFVACDFDKINSLLMEFEWDNLLSSSDVSRCYHIFKTLMLDFCLNNIPVVKKKPYRLPWYNFNLKKLKNLRNKFFRKFKLTGCQISLAKYQRYSRDFNCLDKFLYRNYILGMEENIKSNPKAFWHFIKSKRSNSTIPSAVFMMKSLLAHQTTWRTCLRNFSVQILLLTKRICRLA